MRVAVRSDVGRDREVNQDSAFTDATTGLLVLADGMGGHRAGEIASHLAIEAIVAHVSGGLAGRNGNNDATEDSPAATLTESIAKANQLIQQRAAEDANLEGMGTTVIVALCGKHSVHLAHLGDSRGYIFRAGSLRQVTQDHSLVAEMAAAGEITEKEARAHRLRYVLTRSLGNQSAVVQPDLQLFSWGPGDCLLLCSDGLTNMVDDHKLEKTLRRHSGNLERACEEMVKAANANGGMDNITVILACPE